MCGLVGGLFSCDVDDTLVATVLGHLERRGPDAQDSCRLPRGFLGHTRLAIVDASNEFANQPMFSQCGRHVIVFNGEIYNFKELREQLETDGEVFVTNSDTEVILIGFIREGAQFFKRLEGMFAFAIYSYETDELILARDSFGIKPLVYTLTDDGSLIFGSDVYTLQLFDGSFSINHQAIADFLTFGAVTQNSTVFDEVKWLPAGGCLRVMGTQPAKFQLFQFENIFAPRLQQTAFRVVSFSEAARQLRDLVDASVTAQTMSDSDIGVLLSGGIDSSIVASCAARVVSGRLNVFNLGFEGRHSELDEGAVASRFAQGIDAEFHRYVVSDADIPDLWLEFLSILDQPSVDGFNSFLIAKYASSKVKVLLSGLGSDELFGGYNHFRYAGDHPMLPKFFRDFFSKIHRSRPNRICEYLSLKGTVAADLIRAKRMLSNKDRPFSVENLSSNYPVDFGFNCEAVDSITQLCRYEITNYLRCTLLRDSDVTSMASGVEIRPVFLSKDILDFALRIPGKFKVKGSVLKAILIEAFKDDLPSFLFETPKRGFELPFDYWMNRCLGDSLGFALNHYEQSGLDIVPEPMLFKFKKRLSRKQLVKSDWSTAILLGWLYVKQRPCEL